MQIVYDDGRAWLDFSVGRMDGNVSSSYSSFDDDDGDTVDQLMYPVQHVICLFLSLISARIIFNVEKNSFIYFSNTYGILNK